MEARYFNKWESGRIYELIENDPISAKILYEEYLEKYPKDYYICASYIRTLTTLGEYERALEVLEETKLKIANNPTFLNEKEKNDKVNRFLILNELYILMGEEKYEEAYNFYIANSHIVEYYNLNISMTYCKNKLGILEHEGRDDYPYIFRQIIEYSEKDFLRHIKKHLSDESIDVEEPNNALFISDFPISEVINEVKKYLPSDKNISVNMHSDKYTFKYDRCGRCDNRVQDYFSVICFHNTSDMITMCPTQYGKRLAYFDLNYMVEKPKVKVMSQIEKFNRRYRNVK